MYSHILKDETTLLIFSDTHLTHKFDKKKYDFLVKLISQADNVIINGDFWDYYLTSWEKFLKSQWKALFPLLKSKHAIYIYGNHDTKLFSDTRVNLFSVLQTEKYKLKVKNHILNIQHGHLIVPTIDVSHSSFRRKSLISISQKLEEKNIFLLSKPLMLRISRKQNKVLKKYSVEELPANEILVCGHTHLAVFGEKAKYLNTGRIRYGEAQGLFVTNGQFQFINARY